MSTQDKTFSPEKVFIWLFVLTALEVGWGLALKDASKLVLWGGLGIFAFFKGWLIAVYFMHLKFEGWVVKSLLVPTPLLILVIWGYVSPDISNSHHLDHPIGTMYDPQTGGWRDKMGLNDAKHGEHAEGGEAGDAHEAGAASSEEG